MKSLLRLFSLTAILLSAPLANAALLSSVSYFSCAAPCTNPTFVATIAQDSSALTHSDPYGSIFAQADYGVLKASVDTTYASASGGLSFSTGSSLAQFSDTFTLGGLSGAQDVTVVLHFDGELGAVGEQPQGTSASMTISLTVDGHTIALAADYFGNIPEPLASASSPALSAMFTLDYGIPISLAALLQVSGAFGGYAHFANTATLEFIVPEGTTLTSGSGTEYLATTVAIPEPATLALALLALAALAVTRHRYRRA